MAKTRDPAVESLAAALARRTREAAPELALALPDGRVRCVACGHRCVVPPGLEGVCRVRFNRDGRLRVPTGYVSGLQIDPIEKKPFFHVLPGSEALSFGMLGCDLHCPYCQNWLTSQTLRDEASRAGPRDVDARTLVDTGERAGTPVVVSTYNEPLITAEWAVEVFGEARARGMLCGFVSNGNATPEALRYLRPWAELYKIDLKGFRPETYRAVGARLEAVLDTIRAAHELGFWVEVVTLVVPGFNDSREELEGTAAFLASVSEELPWHVTAFHADYRMASTRDTTSADLARAAAIGRAAGLRYVYAGNRPGALDGGEDTRCPGCAGTLVRRHGFTVLENRLGPDGACPDCRTAIPGIWRVAGTPPGAR